jgi:hypothetical protein
MTAQPDGCVISYEVKEAASKYFLKNQTGRL